MKNNTQKKITEINKIFENLAIVNSKADNSEETLRISFDAKVEVKMGNFSRGGKKQERDQGR